MDLNRHQFAPHAFMDPQPEGLYVGQHLFRSARVYAADLDDPRNADDPNDPDYTGEPVNRASWRAHVPLENGDTAILHWNESKSHSEGDVHVARHAWEGHGHDVATSVESPDAVVSNIEKISRLRTTDRRSPEERDPRTFDYYERFR